VPRDIVQFRKFAKHLDGQLTATRVLAEADRDTAFARLPVLERKGRIRLNGFPTGVEGSHAMVHGGPLHSPRLDKYKNY
jgi:alpha-ketoglutaric semialdehyde dehydrogenase